MSKTLHMFDSIVLNAPANPEAVAGYVDGHWPDYEAMVKKYPNALHVSISALGRDARILDREPGDASLGDVVPWMERQFARGEKLPGVYASVSNMQACIDALTTAGIARDRYVVWTANYNFVPHIDGPGSYPGFNSQANATQYTDHADGLNLDESLCDESFFPELSQPHEPWHPDFSIFPVGPFPYKPYLDLNERETVEEYYGAIQHPEKYHDWLMELSHRLVFLRKRVWTMAHRDDPVSWGYSHRGERWKELLRITDPASFNRLFG